MVNSETLVALLRPLAERGDVRFAALRERAAIQERRVAAEAAFMARIRAEHTEVVTPDVIARWAEETK